MKNQSVGIIGLGAFGQFVASLVPDDVSVLGFARHTPNTPTRLKMVPFAETAACDVVILAIPLNAYPEVLQQLKPHLRPSTLLIDVCSVKVVPQKLINQAFPGHPNLLLTHPLFGPQSASGSTKGHKLVVTKSVGELARQVIDYCKSSLKLQISQMTADEHDKIMANVHALTFFVARGLAGTSVNQGLFDTPSYKMLLDLVKFDHSHSQELFETIQLGNPYAEEARQKLLKSFLATDSELRKRKLG